MTNAAVASEQDSATTVAAGPITAEQFELDARAFLDAAAPKRPTETLVWGEGSDHVGLLPERTPEQQAAVDALTQSLTSKLLQPQLTILREATAGTIAVSPPESTE